MVTDVMTIFLDIDGCIVRHSCTSKNAILLPGVRAAFMAWIKSGYTIILTTGRKESLRQDTELMLRNLELSYDHLIMGLPRGPRLIINDRKPGSLRNTALAINLTRNEGFEKGLFSGS